MSKKVPVLWIFITILVTLFAGPKVMAAIGKR